MGGCGRLAPVLPSSRSDSRGTATGRPARRARVSEAFEPDGRVVPAGGKPGPRRHPRVSRSGRRRGRLQRRPGLFGRRSVRPLASEHREASRPGRAREPHEGRHPGQKDARRQRQRHRAGQLRDRGVVKWEDRRGRRRSPVADDRHREAHAPADTRRSEQAEGAIERHRQRRKNRDQFSDRFGERARCAAPRRGASEGAVVSGRPVRGGASEQPGVR